MPALFPLGRIVVTESLQRAIEDIDPEHWSEELAKLIARHMSGDWGEVNEHNRAKNDGGLHTNGRLLSVYNTSKGIRVWIITEEDRSVTTVSLAEESKVGRS